MTYPYRWSLVFLLILWATDMMAQQKLTLSRREAETIFLDQNLDLMAERLEIPKAQAAVLQAKLWPNPTFSVEELNLWALPGQIEPLGEELPPLIGNFGRHLQFSVGIEQLIQTAGKRKKLMDLEQVSADKAHRYLEDLLRNLKVEFRHQLTELQYLQFYKRVYDSQIEAIMQLADSYERQVEQGHVPRSEFVRLKALELQFSKNSKDLRNDINEAQKELKLLMRLPAETDLVITDEDFMVDTEQFEVLRLNTLIETAKASRSDLRLAELEERHYEKLFVYEKAQRTPDINLKAGYDRGGNILYNFIGFGVDIDLPVFNKNQGNIEAARIGIVQSQIQHDQKILSVENELVMAYQNLSEAIGFYKSIEPGYEMTLDVLLDSYTKNFKDRNINLLEFIDFLEAYMDNKGIILEAGKELHLKAEELNYAIGQDIIR